MPSRACLVRLGTALALCARAAAQCPEFSADFDFPGVAVRGQSIYTDERISALTHFDSGAGPQLYVGGNCTVAGSVDADYIAMWTALRGTRSASAMS
jgi:hypothetical protein